MKSKQLILIIIFIFVITVTTSFAYFTANIINEEGTTIELTGGKMSMAFDGGNSINIGNVIPDENPVYTKHFTITGNNTTPFDMGYSLYLVVDENTFSNYAIQYKLISENTGESGTVLEGNEELIGIKTGASKTLLGYGTFDSPTSGAKVHTYDLELYFYNQRFNQNDDQDKTFKAHMKIEDYILEGDRLISSLDQLEKINRANMYYYFANKVEQIYYRDEDRLSESELEELAVLRDDFNDAGDLLWDEIFEQTTFLTTTLLKEEIESIEFVDTNEVEEGPAAIDVSERQNESVKLWYTDTDENGLYEITIGQKGGVKAPIHSDYLFSGLINLKSLSGKFITTETKTMAFMLYDAGESAAEFELDLSGWDTSNVTHMYGMFYGAGESATTWSIGDLSGWDTSNVTDISGMFLGAGSSATTWSIGDISGWDTSNVTDMSLMFLGAGSSATTWNIGDLSSWDTSNVTDMSLMFNRAGYSANTWSIGDLSGWDTSNVIDMSGMFDYAGYSATTWSIGDISGWDISKLEHSACDIFNGLSSTALTSLLTARTQWGCS